MTCNTEQRGSRQAKLGARGLTCSEGLKLVMVCSLCGGAGHDMRICPYVPKKFQTDAKSLGGDGAVPDVDMPREISSDD